VWVELVPGTGQLVAADTLVMCTDRDGARRLVVGDEVVSPVDVQVRGVTSSTAERIVVSGNPLDDATVLHVYEWSPAGGWRALTDGLGVHAAAAGGDTTIIRSAVVDEPGGRWRLPSGGALERHAERPLVRPNVIIATHTADAPTTAVLLPHDVDVGEGGTLPVLLDPYGGPHALRVTQSYNAHLTSQWFADQGFAVIVADGRGTPGRGSTWERAVHGDLANPTLDDQVDALHAVAEQVPGLDLGRVAIRGWSFGGYLAALAVLCRPDVFHAAIAGAPVTEWRLYDTHYTEHYMGLPADNAEGYRDSTILAHIDGLASHLLLLHGMADDNVLFTNSTRLMSALQQRGVEFELMTYPGAKHGLRGKDNLHRLKLTEDFFARCLKP